MLFGLAGCGDIYANMRITTSLQSNTLDIVLDPSDTSTFTTTFDATVEGYSEGMDTLVDFEFAPHGVVTAKVVSETNGVNTVSVTAIADADNMPTSSTTTMTIVSRENSRIRSAPITVNLHLPATAMSMREDATPHLVIGGEELVLEPEKLVNFEPYYTTDRDVVFTLAEEYPGIHLVTNEESGKQSLVATKADTSLNLAGASWGTIELIATIRTSDQPTEDAEPNVLSCPIYILVHDDITAEDILLRNINPTLDDDIYLQEFNMATSISSMSQIQFEIAFADDSPINGQTYEVETSVADTTIANVSPDIYNQGVIESYKLKAFDVGSTKLSVTIKLLGTVGNADNAVMRVYHSITREVDIYVEQKAYDVLLSQGNNAPTSNAIEIDVIHDSTLSSNVGTEVNVRILPDNVLDKSYRLALFNPLNQAGELINQDVTEDVVVQCYRGGKLTPINVGTAIDQDGTFEFVDGDSVMEDKIYIHYQGKRLGTSFELYVVSNSSGEYNKIKCNISASATSLWLNVNDKDIGKDLTQPILPITLGQYISADDEYPNTLDLTLKYTSNIEGASVDFSAFNLNIARPNIIGLQGSRIVNGNPVYTIVGLSQGESNITIGCNTEFGGISKVFTFVVVVPTDTSNSSIQHNVISGKVTDITSHEGIPTSITMITTTRLSVRLSTLPDNSTIDNIHFAIENIGAKSSSLMLSQDDNGHYLTAGAQDNLNIQPILPTDNVYLVCSYSCWSYTGVEWCIMKM